MIDALVDYLRDKWEWDKVWRDQVTLAIAIGLVGLIFAWLETRIRKGARVTP